jgi:hypothetical protein
MGCISSFSTKWGSSQSIFFLLLTIVLSFFGVSNRFFLGLDFAHSYPTHLATLITSFSINLTTILTTYLINLTIINYVLCWLNFLTALTTILTTYFTDLITLIINNPIHNPMPFSIIVHMQNRSIRSSIVNLRPFPSVMFHFNAHFPCPKH